MDIRACVLVVSLIFMPAMVAFAQPPDEPRDDLADMSPIVLACAQASLPEPLAGFLYAHKAKILGAAAEEADFDGQVIHLDAGAGSGTAKMLRRAVRSFPQAEHAARRWAAGRSIDNLGRLPWVAVERYDGVARIMRGDDHELLAVEIGRCLRVVSATACPLNTTALDGEVLKAAMRWDAGAGPREASAHRTIRHRLQGVLVDRLAARLKFECRVWPGLITPVDRPTEAVFAVLADSYDQAHVLAELDQTALERLGIQGAADFVASSDQYYAAIEMPAISVLEARLEAAARLFARLMVSAWQGAGQPALAGPASSSAVTDHNQPEAPFVGSRSSQVYHRASCRHVHRITAANRVTFASPEEAEAAGRTPCKTCKPDEE